MQDSGTPDAGMGLKESTAAGLCYVVSLLSIAFLVLAPYNQNKVIRFHALQSIFLGIGFLVAYFAYMAIAAVLTFIYIGIVLFMLLPFVSLAVLIAYVVLVVRVFQGREVVVPIVGQWAKQLA